jgi:ATP-dependent RNA helicase DeaD
VHRIGRTGRAGRTGDALLFVTPRERHLLQSIERATRKKLTPMQLPSIEDVNEYRVSKFTDSITQTLASDKLDFFRDLVGRYEQEHNVPAVDVAAALAVLAQDGKPLLLEPDPAPAQRGFDGPRERGTSRDSRSGQRGPAPRRGVSSVPLTAYTIDVGKRHKVEPRQIVGAIANEGGLSRGDFGHIDIREDHSIVELPANLSPETWRALKKTRISGRLIALSEAGAAAASGTPARGKPPRQRKSAR